MKLLFMQKIYQRTAEIYNLLANPKRLEIINLLRGTELSVEKLTKVLRQERLLLVWRNHLTAYRSISDQKVVPSCQILN